MGIPHITVIVPSYNNESYVEKNLSSIKGQTYPNFDVIYVDDASTDRTLLKVKKELLGVSGEVVSNKERQYAMKNIYEVVSSLPKSEIVVVVDGDDWLARSDALEKIAGCYEQNDVWMTFGRYVKYPLFDLGPVQEQYLGLDIRNEPWFLSHVKTFYAGLFQKINKNDLMIEGEFFRSAVDLAMMWPMYEMAGSRIQQMRDVLYVYNMENINHIASSRPNEQIKIAQYLKASLKPMNCIHEL